MIIRMYIWDWTNKKDRSHGMNIFGDITIFGPEKLCNKIVEKIKELEKDDELSFSIDK